MTIVAQKTPWKIKSRDKILNDPQLKPLFADHPESVDIPAAIMSWVNSNVATMQEARVLIAKLLYITRYLVRHIAK